MRGSKASNWTRLKQRLFALLLQHGTGGYEKLTSLHRQELLRDVRGTVLEIGPGTGANFKYFPKGIQWIGLEPNPFLADNLRKSLASTPHRTGFELFENQAEQIPMEKGSVDFVVGTLVLCSVTSQSQVLAELHRVLKPGGKFLFLEHVAAPRGTSLRKLQNFATPITRCIGDGCRLNLETWSSIESSGFSSCEIEHLSLPVPFHGPHIRGAATR